MRSIARRPLSVATLLGGSLVLGGALALAGPASAEDPTNLADQVVDSAGVLTDGEEVELEAQFDVVTQEEGVQPFVVYVSDFGGLPAEQWAEETAVLSNLSDDEVLLAVAVDEGAFGVAVAENSPVSEGDVRSVVNDEVTGYLSAGDWAGGAEAFGAGLADTGGGAGTLLLLGLGGLAVIVGVGAFAAARSRKRNDPKEQERRRIEALPEDHPMRLPMDTLRTRAGSALVEADDAVRASAAELEFAKAQFGLQRTDDFSAALASAEGAVQNAFHTRRLLDDDQPETEPEERRMLVSILERTDEVNTTLKDQQDEFKRLRAIEGRVEEVLDEIGQRARETRELVSNSRIELRALQGRYPASTLESVVKDPDQADALLDSALRSVEEGKATAVKNRSAAVVHARIAEEAVGQAVTLAKRVSGAGATLEDAAARINEAMASLSADVQDANRLGQGDPLVETRTDAALEALALGEQARAGGDPIRALEQLGKAEAEIDAALAPRREEAENRARATQQARGRLARADARLQSIDDYISTRRGAIGGEARVDLREAERDLDEAHQVIDQDPGRALQAIDSAERRIDSAERRAKNDTDRFELAGYGGYGGYGRNTHHRGGIDMGSLLLGGIVGGLLGGGDNGGGGGFGGGGFGGGFGGFGGDSFGGRF